jgi:rhamnopyranosyl-N-acetylglucosaminyl-diphospho-decaprenol beta-1,3/1,4-galactofuranosyltransferase
MKDELKVAAVVVTYNRKELLKKCLRSLLNQTKPIDEIVVIDNASTDGTDQMICNEFPEITYVRLSENLGGAGGFHDGIKLAYEKGYYWIWVMDDDAFPEPTTLEELMAHSNGADILVPAQVDSLGRKYGAGLWKFGYIPVNLDCASEMIPIEMFAFVGPLFRREVVQCIGFPRKDFFIHADDLEWALRAKLAGFTAYAVPSAIIFHEYGKPRILRRFGRVSVRCSQTPWKHYYEMRNTLLMLNHFQWPKRHVEKVSFLYRAFRWSLGDILYESDWRQRLYYRWRGVLHGLLGKTGKIVIPGQPR